MYWQTIPRVMDGQSQPPRQGGQPSYHGPLPGSSQHLQRQASDDGGSSQANLPFSGPRPSSTVPGSIAPGFGFYSDPSHYAVAPVSSGPGQYHSPVPLGQSRPQTLAQYGSSFLFDGSQPSSQGPSYSPAQQYAHSRQSAAIEALSSQFASIPHFDMSGSGATVQSPVGSMGFQQSDPNIRQTVGQAYTTQAGVEGFSEGAAVIDRQVYGGIPSSSASPGTALQQCETTIRRNFDKIQHGRLAEVGKSMLDLSDWLLSHVIELAVDNQDLYNERLQMWKEFNTCWLATLQKQKDLTQSILDAGEEPGLPENLIQKDMLERIGREIVRLCDKVERHGLVDYEMGVWEEQIISILQECLDLLEIEPEQEDT